MDVFKIRQELKTKSIYDLPLRVTFYARVSSEKDEQLNSLDNQINYYENFIKNNKKWTFIPGYIDEGISGISTKKRESFQHMLEEANQDKFDLIITKEISRFARNTLDSIQYTRKLLSLGVCVYFQNDNINTVDEDSELRLTIMSSIAQDELRKLSSRIKFGHSQAIKNGVVIGNSRIFGYKKDNKKLVIDESEAPMVRLIFELYSTDKYSMKQIENILYEKGYRNTNGKKIYHTTISNIIANPKYKGYYCGNKVKVIDMFSKKQLFLPESEWVTYKDETGNIVPAIVDEDIWNKANVILKRRSKDVKAHKNISNHENLLTGKLYCSCCNKLYYLKDNRTDKKGNIHSGWVCSGKIQNGSKSCKSFTVYEEEIKKLIFLAFKEWVTNTDEIIQTYVNIANSVINDETIKDDIRKLENEIKKEQAKQEKLLELCVSGSMNNDDFKRMNDKICSNIKSLEDDIFNLNEKKSINFETKKYVNEIISNLKEASKIIDIEMVDRSFINKYIERIDVTPIDNSTMDLKIKLLVNQDYTISYNKHGSAGQMSNNICPIQTIHFIRDNRNVNKHKIIINYIYSLYI